MTLKGKVAKVVTCDVDEAVLSNPGADETIVILPHQPLPFADGAFDLIVSNFVFEHIADPARVSGELRRILNAWRMALRPHPEPVLPDLAGDSADSQFQTFAYPEPVTARTAVHRCIPHRVQTEQQTRYYDLVPARCV